MNRTYLYNEKQSGLEGRLQNQITSYLALILERKTIWLDEPMV